jgi:hypothetical protein
MTAMSNRGWSNSWLGVALVAFGLVFLVQNYFGFELHNWWALFILIPAIGSFGAAYSVWREHGNTTAAAGSLTMGVPWGRVWPVFVILAGVAMLIPNFITRREKT